MASDCGLCEKILCGGKVRSRDQFQTLVSNILCDMRTTRLVVLCDDETPFIRVFIYDSDGTFVEYRDTDLEGAPYIVTGTVGSC